MQSGPVFTRTVLGRGLEPGTAFTVFAEPRDVSDRLDTLRWWTCALEGFRLAATGQFEALMDVYNLFNANTVLNANTLTGPAFGSPLTVLSPRIIRFGGRFLF